MGRSPYVRTAFYLQTRGIHIDFNLPPVGLPESAGVEISFDKMNLIHWPVLIMYPEFNQTDFVQDVAEYLRYVASALILASLYDN